MDETSRRRQLQQEHNEKHGITPETVIKAIRDMLPESGAADYVTIPILKPDERDAEPEKLLEEMRSEMLLLAEQLEFEEAARMRDKIRALERETGVAAPAGSEAPSAPARASARPSANPRAKAAGAARAGARGRKR
jgi:excinuclease ABC subunit B